MRHIHKLAIAGAMTLAGATAGLALAAPFGPGAGPGGPSFGPMAGGPSGFGPGAHFRGGDPAAFVDSRLGALQAELKITAQQQPAWDAFAAKVRQQAAAMQKLHDKVGQSAATAPDRMAQGADFMKQRAVGMEATAAAMKDLYAVLTPEQRVVVDRGFGPGGSGRGPGMRFGPHAW